MSYNLTVSDPDLGLSVDVGWLTSDGPHEVVAYRIRSGEDTLYEGEDLRVPLNNEVRSIELRAMRSLASFLDAYNEARDSLLRRYVPVGVVAENADLFGDLYDKVPSGDLETLVWTIRDIVGEDE